MFLEMSEGQIRQSVNGARSAAWAVGRVGDGLHVAEQINGNLVQFAIAVMPFCDDHLASMA